MCVLPSGQLPLSRGSKLVLHSRLTPLTVWNAVFPEEGGCHTVAEWG